MPCRHDGATKYQIILLYLAMSELCRCPKLHKDWPRYGHYKIYFRAVAADGCCIFTAVVWSIRWLRRSQQASPGTLYCLRWLFGRFYRRDRHISPRATMIYNMTAISTLWRWLGGFMVVMPYFGAATWWECEFGDWFDVCCSSDAGTYNGLSKRTIRFLILVQEISKMESLVVDSDVPECKEVSRSESSCWVSICRTHLKQIPSCRSNRSDSEPCGWIW